MGGILGPWASLVTLALFLFPAVALCVRGLQLSHVLGAAANMHHHTFIVVIQSPSTRASRTFLCHSNLPTTTIARPLVWRIFHMVFQKSLIPGKVSLVWGNLPIHQPSWHICQPAFQSSSMWPSSPRRHTTATTAITIVCIIVGLITLEAFYC